LEERGLDNLKKTCKAVLRKGEGRGQEHGNSWKRKGKMDEMTLVAPYGIGVLCFSKNCSF
jgi:hypothetical protein